MGNGSEAITFTRSDAAIILETCQKVEDIEPRVGRLEKAALWIAGLLIATLVSSTATLVLMVLRLPK